MEAPGLQGVSQLYEGVVIGAVAIADHGYGQGTLSLDRGHIFDEQIGHPASIDRGAEDH